MNELPNGWESATAGELCTIVGGATPRTDARRFWEGDVPWLTPDDLSRDRRKYIDQGRRWLSREGLGSCAATLVPAGTVLFTSRAPIGYTAIAARPLATNQGFKSLVPSTAISSEFLYWQLQHLTEVIRAMGSGTTFAEVSKKVMATVPLVVAPLAEQQRIVTAIEEAFSKLDAGDAGLRTVRQLLKRMRDAILAAAVTGRLVPQDPTDTPATKLLVDLGVDPIQNPESPNGWANAAISTLLEHTIGGVWGAEEGADEVDVAVLRVTEMRADGSLDPSTAVRRSITSRQLETRRLQEGDLLLEKSGGGPARPVGRVGLVRHVPDPSVCANFMQLLRPQRRICLPEYLEVALRQFHASSGTEPLQTASTNIRNLQMKDYFAVPLAVPPILEQERIVNEVDRQLSFVEACERALGAGLERSTALRRSVLKAAFEGRLVPQDPTDEPASVLLERIRAEWAAAPKSKGGRARSTA